MLYRSYNRHRSSWTWKSYRGLQLLLNCLPLIGVAFILFAVQANHHDRPSLEWPTVSGTVMHCVPQFHRRSGHGGWSVDISYRYDVNGQRCVGNCISLWSPNGGRLGKRDIDAFVADHPVRSKVTVYYDPQHPENAVLEPGADEEANRVGIWCGSIIFVLLGYLTWRMNRFFNKLVAWRKANPPRTRHSHRAENPQTQKAGEL